MRSLAHTAAAGWPLSAALALALAGQQLRAGRRRQALNRAMHELRRPLQAMALALSAPTDPPFSRGSLQMAMSALGRLDAELNGAEAAEEQRPERCRDLLETAVARWRSRAALAGGSIELRWRAPETTRVDAPGSVERAVDNLLVNAIEHGGPAISVEASLRRDRIRICVRDSGRASRPAARRETPRETVARLTGRRRRGHGLSVVREVAARQGGRFALQRAEDGSVAVLELPPAGGAGALAA